MLSWIEKLLGLEIDSITNEYKDCPHIQPYYYDIRDQILQFEELVLVYRIIS